MFDKARGDDPRHDLSGVVLPPGAVTPFFKMATDTADWRGLRRARPEAPRLERAAFAWTLAACAPRPEAPQSGL
jgi:CelD/BcsL family acetyltransferase involved in cellulose biosynthesis